MPNARCKDDDDHDHDDDHDDHGDDDDDDEDDDDDADDHDDDDDDHDDDHGARRRGGARSNRVDLIEHKPRSNRRGSNRRARHHAYAQARLLLKAPKN